MDKKIENSHKRIQTLQMNTFDYYNRRKEEWSISETDQLYMEYLYKTLNIIQIADIHRRTPGDILYKCKTMNIISEYKYARGYSDYISSNLYNQIMSKIHNENTKRLENTKKENKKKENNVGKPWTSEEDFQLISEYNSCIHVTEISKIHKRNIGGIMSRLKMLHSNKQTTIEKYFEKIDKCVGTDKKVRKVRKNITHDIKKLKQTVTELKQTVTELNDMLKALYEFETV
jgi:hypothetical protein